MSETDTNGCVTFGVGTIELSSGKPFNVLHPVAAEIEIKDIAHEEARRGE